MADVQLSPGVFRDFRASVQFHLGKIQQDVKKGTVIQFDGTTMRLDGVTHVYPELRSAIREGWLALVGSNVSDYIPQSANVQVRAAQAGKGAKQASTTVQQDETYVGQARKPQASTRDGVKIENKVFNPTLVKDTEGDGRTVGPAMRKPVPTVGDASSDGEPVAKIKTATKKSFTVDGSTSLNADPTAEPDITEVIEHTKSAKTNDLGIQKDALREGQSSETGAVVANLRTSTRRKVTVTDANVADQEISKLDNATRTVLAPKGRAVAAVAGDDLESVVRAADSEGQAKALAEQKRAQRLASMGVQVKVAQEGPPVAVDVTPPQGVIEAPVGPMKVRKPQSIEETVVVGDDVEIAPGFRWNKKLHWKVRVKNAVQFRDQPERLAAIRAYEVPSVVKQIDAELSK